MGEEILKLAKECGLYDLIHHHDEHIIETFYRAAFTTGIKEAAQEAWNLTANVSNYRDADYVRDGITALEMK